MYVRSRWWHLFRRNFGHFWRPKLSKNTARCTYKTLELTVVLAKAWGTTKSIRIWIAFCCPFGFFYLHDRQRHSLFLFVCTVFCHKSQKVGVSSTGTYGREGPLGAPRCRPRRPTPWTFFKQLSLRSQLFVIDVGFCPFCLWWRLHFEYPHRLLNHEQRIEA